MAFTGPARATSRHTHTRSQSEALLACMLRGRDRRRSLVTRDSSEVLENRALLTHVDVLFAPGTAQSVIDEHLAHDHAHESGEDHEDESGEDHAGESGIAEFNADDRWGNTATNTGGGLGQGDPTTLTWSIADDGTHIPGFNGEDAAPSNLIAFLAGIYGSNSPGDGDLTNEPWFDEIQRGLDRWSAVSGLNYVYEPNDDGADFSGSSTAAPGIAGVRGDVRIGGHNIDGNFGVLAYNFFPDNGEMVIDTGDSFYGNTSNDSIRLRNVIAHEAGHGFGLSHVVSNNAQFLMEPSLNSSFDGPQLDDILGAQRLYGDAFEFENGNESVATATGLGSIADGATVTIGADAGDTFVAATDTGFVSIDDNSDTDVYSFSVEANASVSVSVDPVGPTYSQGRQNGSQSPFNAGSQSDLTVEILSGTGTVLATANANGIGDTETISSFDLGTAAGNFHIRITGAQNAIQLYQLDVSVSVDAPSSSVSIAAANATQAEGDSGATAFTFDVTRTGDLGTTGTVAWVAAGSGTNAANAGDFGGSLPSGTLTFDPGVGTQQITIDVAGDVIVENNEGFTVTLSSPSTGVTIGTASASGTIENDDTSISIAADNATQAEGDAGSTAFTFTVTRTGDTSGAGSVSYSVTGNGATADDFAGGVFPTGTVNFTAGQTSQTVTIDVAGDLDVEDDEDFTVTLSNPTDGATLGSASASGTITNDDTDLSVAATNASQSEGDSGSTAFTFTVTRTGSTAGPQTVGYAVTGSGTNAADSGDFTGGVLPTGTLTFADGDESATITINVSDDSDVEPDEGFTVTLANPSGNAEISTATADGTILNDDVNIDITLVVNQASGLEGDSGSTAFTFQVTRSGFTGLETTVDFDVLASASGANAADFTGGVLPSGTVTFGVGDTDETITINVSGDTLAEADEAFTVGLSNANNGEIVTGTATSTITNDDSNLSISALDASQTEGNAGESTVFRFLVTRTGDTSGTATASFAVSGDADADDFGGDLPGGTVSFAVGQTTQQIEITVAGDDDIEPDETFTVTLSSAVRATITADSASSTITNDDQEDSGVFLDGGVLTVIGTGDNDYVSLYGQGRNISVFTYNFSTDLYTYDVFGKSDVDSISVDVVAGHDQVYLDGSIYRGSTIELGDGNDVASGGRRSDVINGGNGNDVINGNNGSDVIHGGAGNDYIRGGNGRDILRGGNGNNWIYGDNGHDVLVGGDDFDYLHGGRGRDIQIGGGGGDWLVGSNGDDILIGGSTIYDDDDAALTALLTEWTTRTSYNNRINTIRSGTGSLNGIRLEAGTTVHDDGATDVMIGNRGRDWYFGDTSGSDSDLIFRSFNELVDALP